MTNATSFPDDVSPGAKPEVPRVGLLACIDDLVSRRPAAALLALAPLALAAGFLVTRGGTSTWDTSVQAAHGAWLLGKWTGRGLPAPYEAIKWYGPLWEYVLLPFAWMFGFLRDPSCVRHAVTFALLPCTLLLSYALLRRIGESPSTSLLAVSLLVSNVRLCGHALTNVKDFTFACGYLVVTLVMWLALAPARRKPEPSLLRHPLHTAGLTALSVVPFLLRVPALAHWAWLALYSLWTGVHRPATRLSRLTMLLPVVLGPLLVYAAWPPLWESGLRGFADGFTRFSSFAWSGAVRAFGVDLASDALPWWYPFAWVPVSWTPLGLVVLLAGGMAYLLGVARQVRRLDGWPFDPMVRSFGLWLAVFAAAPWLAFLLLRPILYDEERHLLFAMPLLAVASALGCSGLRERAKSVLAAALAASALWSVCAWGKYSYVYKNPLLPRATNADFMGDYWGISSGALAQAMSDRLPEGARVLVLGPVDAIDLELARRGRSRLLPDAKARSFDFTARARRAGQLYVAAVNRNRVCAPLLEHVRLGIAQELWRDEMPGGGVAALLVHYPGRCEDCPEALAPAMEPVGRPR